MARQHRRSMVSKSKTLKNMYHVPTIDKFLASRHVPRSVSRVEAEAIHVRAAGVADENDLFPEFKLPHVMGDEELTQAYIRLWQTNPQFFLDCANAA